MSERAGCRVKPTAMNNRLERGNYRGLPMPGPWTPLDAMYHELASLPTDTGPHFPTLRALASRCDKVIEFGVRDVITTWALLAGRPGSLLSVDIVRPAEVRIMEAEGAAARAGVGFRFIQASTLELPPVDCDFLFIDTLHTFAHLTKELARHAIGVRRYIAFHDTVTYGERGEDGSTPGLVAAIENFLMSPLGAPWRVSWHDIGCNGLTVLSRDRSA